MNPLPGENWVLRVVVETKEHEVIISRLTDTVADDRPRKELQFLLNTQGNSYFKFEHVLNIVTERLLREVFVTYFR